MDDRRALSFRVFGRPRPQPRPRVVKGRAVSTADPKARLWRQTVERAAREAVAASGYGAPALRGAVRMTVVFQFATKDAARWAQPHTAKPDASNLLKLVEDAMEAAGVFANDSQLAAVEPVKMWGERDCMGVTVTEYALDCPQTGSGAAKSDFGSASAPDWLSRS